MTQEIISIKPHHFIDIITSFGAGKRTFEPHPYGHAVHTLSQRILNNRNVPVEIETGADDICRPCIHNIDGNCVDTIDTSFRPNAPASKKEWNLIIDRRWCERLGIQDGDRFSAREFCRIVLDRMGDITPIYKEIPANRTENRHANLLKGLNFYLDQNGVKI